jgi:hypothetical protein
VLFDLYTGDIVARYERYPGGPGVLKIRRSGMEMIDVVVATGITMQYSWEQTRKLRGAGGKKAHGESNTAGIGHGFDLGEGAAGGF